MKIIAKTQGGYLIEASAHEILICSGYKSFRDAPGWQNTGSYSGDGHFSTGTEIDVRGAHLWLDKLRENERGVRSAAAFMRQLADHVEAGLPSTIVPPPEEEHGQ